MKENVSPEERLLRLIRGPKKQPIDTAENSSSRATHTTAPQSQSAVFRPKEKILSFLNTQKIIWVAFGLSCLYLASSFIYPIIGLREIELSQVELPEISATDAEPELELKPYEFYLEGTEGRQIFSSPAIQASKGSIGMVDADLIKDINLVGIISGVTPQAIIEDKKAGKTYYLNKGQFFGAFQVEDIQEGKVILNLNGESVELYL